MKNKKNKKDKINYRSAFSGILTYIKPHMGFVILSIILAALSVVSSLYIPILIGRGIDLIIGPNMVDFEGLIKIIVVILAMIALYFVANWVMGIVNNRITYKVSTRLRIDAFNKLQKLPLSYVDAHPYGDIISRLIADIDQFADGLLIGFTQLFTGLITIAGTLIFMFSMSVTITFVVIVITPASLIAATIIAKSTFKMFKEQAKVKGQMTALIDEMINNEKVVKAFAYEEKAEERMEEINKDLTRKSKLAIFFSSTTNPVTRFVNGIVYASVTIIGALSVMKGNLSIGKLTSFLSYANQYTKPFNEISTVIAEMQNALACATRVFELLAVDEESAEPSDMEELGTAEGSIEIKDVYFSYTPEKKLIEDLNLLVRPGQRIAIVGPTGCGKSTIINLLMRFYDVDNGSITVDGMDIRDIKRHSLRANYGMVLQETWLKTATVAENIAYAKPDATREEVIEAAKKVHAHNFIMQLENGYDTILTDNGGSLSEGQKQLLCIARVMLALPPMLILDEATSSIDALTEIEIQNAFAVMMEGRTSFIVAHRLSTIKNADIILVMNNGKIIEKGNHEELLAAKGFYADLYESQFKVE